jgi:hypothetical protein
LDKVYDQIDPNKKVWEKMSPYDYAQYCKKWMKSNLTCGKNDKTPGYSEETPADYIPQKQWKTSEIPQGSQCSEPYYFQELNGPGSAPAADLDDKLEMLKRVLKRARIK